jgi:hypothetical protein
MQQRDFDDFMALLDQVYALQSQRVLSAEAKALYFATLAEHPFDAVKRAAFAHLKDPANGKFPLLPSHIEAQILAVRGGDGRPAPDEAWAVALTSLDERATVVWTTETFEAFQIARPVLEVGDEVGARMAFKDAYTRLVAQARAAGRSAAWQASLGWDAEEREKVLHKAVQTNRLPAPMAAALLPAPTENGDFDADKARENLERLREMIATIPSALERIAATRAEQAAADRARTAERKAELREQAVGFGLSDEGYNDVRGAA